MLLWQTALKACCNSESYISKIRNHLFYFCPCRHTLNVITTKTEHEINMNSRIIGGQSAEFHSLQNVWNSIYLCRGYVLQGSVLFGENFFAGFIYIEHIAALVVKNYCKSLDKLEDGIIRVQLV